MKIPEDVLQPTLIRSGQAGVFLQVKAENKKPDPRFGIVPMHGQSLEEVVKLAKTLKNVLGVVQMGQNGVFALRAKREHIQEIRRNALPQGIHCRKVKSLLEHHGGSCATSMPPLLVMRSLQRCGN